MPTPEPKSYNLDFSDDTIAAVLFRDSSACVICGKQHSDGVHIYVRGLIAKEDGGQPTVENGITLCDEHLYWRLGWAATPSFQSLFQCVLAVALKQGDSHMTGFCTDILDVYEKYGIYTHIEWYVVPDEL